MAASGTTATGTPQNPPEEAPGGANRVLQLVSCRKIDAAVFAMRFATVLCSLLYMVPTFTPSAIANSRLLYERALLASAAAGAFRLHQVTAQQTFLINDALGDLCLRDVTHFFMYSLLFMYNSRRMAIIIVPLLLYHLLESLPYARELLQAIGVNRSPLFSAMRRVDEYREAILQVIAWLEIGLVLILFIQCLYGGVTLFQLILYYRYMVLRYSAFNPYCRQAFASLHTAVEVVRNWPECPDEVRAWLDRLVNFVRWLKPNNVANQEPGTGAGDSDGTAGQNRPQPQPR